MGFLGIVFFFLVLGLYNVGCLVVLRLCFFLYIGSKKKLKGYNLLPAVLQMI